MAEIKAYAVAITTDELFNYIMNPEKEKIAMAKVQGLKGLYGVNNTLEYQYLLFDTKENQAAAYETLKELFNTCKTIFTPAYFDSKYLRGQLCN